MASASAVAHHSGDSGDGGDGGDGVRSPRIGDMDEAGAVSVETGSPTSGRGSSGSASPGVGEGRPRDVAGDNEGALRRVEKHEQDVEAGSGRVVDVDDEMRRKLRCATEDGREEIVGALQLQQKLARGDSYARKEMTKGVVERAVAEGRDGEVRGRPDEEPERASRGRSGSVVNVTVTAHEHANYTRCLVGYRENDTYHSYVEKGFRSLDPGIWFWAVVFAVPVAFVTLVYGVIPLGEPTSREFKEWATFAFVVTPVTWGTVAYFRQVNFFFAVEVDRPFRARLRPILVVMAVTTAGTALNYSVPGTRTPLRLWGALMLGVTLFITWGMLWASESRLVPENEAEPFRIVFRSYLRTEIYIAFYYAWMFFYIIVFRFVDGLGQTALPVVLALVTFISKKVLLNFTTPLPIEPAMFLSGFVLENTEDMIAVMALPSVTTSATLAAIYVVPTVSNLALLLFLTDPWFRFRVWVKEYCIRLWCCGSRGSPWGLQVVPNYDDVPEDRGNTNNKPGYIRRQSRFFFWKLISQAAAMVFYMAFAPVLRYGLNRDFYPFGDDLGADDFSNSMQYAVGNLVSAALSALLGYAFISRKYPAVWDFIAHTHGRMVMDHKYVGYIVAGFVANGLVAMSLVLVHFQMYYGFGQRFSA